MKLNDKLRIKFLEEFLIEEKIEKTSGNFKSDLMEVRTKLFNYCDDYKIKYKYIVRSDEYIIDLWGAIYDIKRLFNLIIYETDSAKFGDRYKDLKEQEELIVEKRAEVQAREEELLLNIAKYNEYKNKNYLRLKDD